MTAKPQKRATLPVPRWLKRAEKLAFNRLVEQRNDTGKPVSEAEIELICDLVDLRSRISFAR
jgi:hypothetical protein